MGGLEESARSQDELDLAVEGLLVCLRDPVKFCSVLWPDTRFWGKQVDILYALTESTEVYVTAGNKLGKDFIGGYYNLTFFMIPQLYFPAEYVLQVDRQTPRHWQPYMRHRRRVVTTSVKDEHMDVLWGEVGQFYRTCAVDLEPYFKMTHHELRYLEEVEAKNPANYLKGQVSATGEGLAGHHAAYTSATGDEASGLDDIVQSQCVTWAKRNLWISNPLPTTNFFRANVKKGDLPAEGSTR